MAAPKKGCDYGCPAQSEAIPQPGRRASEPPKVPPVGTGLVDGDPDPIAYLGDRIAGLSSDQVDDLLTYLSHTHGISLP